MTYWHMQLHPSGEENNYDAGKIVKETNLIGLGYWEKGESQIKQFQYEMNVGDIVLIRKGAEAKALVEVTGKFEDIKENNFNTLDWFQFRRKVKVLDSAKNMPTFPQPRGTLQKSLNPKTSTYKYIDSWYKKLSYALKNIYIEDYKMFKNLEINFVDDNNEALPIVIIAGINGAGKTSLLEYIAKISDMTVYFPVGTDKIENIKETILQKYIDRAFEIDKPSEALRELQVYIKTIFDGLDLTFNLSSIKYNEKEVLFHDNNGNEFDISKLSTGEKTLLSKILYLFFQDYKDKIILIDEPELSLHPSWQNKILKVYKKFADKNNCQIIIATHSPHIIASAKNEYLRILKKNEDGNIEVIEDLKAHGRDMNSILFDVMGEVDYRPREFQYIIDKLHIEIDNKNFEEAKKQLENLKKSYGEEDEVVLEAQMMIDVLSNEE